MDNKSLSHTKWKCQYHIVFIPKYRKKILYGRVRNDVGEIISTLCKYKDVDIIAGAVCVDHIHLSVAIPPKISIANFMGYLKGKSTLMLYDRHPELQSKWDKAFWARGYYVETIGNITDEAVQKYIKEQAEESRKEGAAGGCQAEIGSASAMAAGGVVHLSGGSAKEIANAAALALKNLLGLACDPVAGLVEVPCVKRNVMGAVNALTSADLTSAGIFSKIPPDEVIDAMRSIGRSMSEDIRETGKGGLAGTPTGVEIRERMAGGRTQEA